MTKPVKQTLKDIRMYFKEVRGIILSKADVTLLSEKLQNLYLIGYNVGYAACFDEDEKEYQGFD